MIDITTQGINVRIADKQIVCTLIHRYDAREDILSAKLTNKCSDAIQRANGEFSHVIIIPTAKAKDNLAIWAKATSEQYKPSTKMEWKKKAKYAVRVDIADANYTTLEKVKAATSAGGWQSQWSSRIIAIDLSLL